MKRLLSSLLMLAFFSTLYAGEPSADRRIFEIRIYHFTTAEQETILDNFLKNAYFPALHKQGIKMVGAYKPLANDTAKNKRLYVFIPYKSIRDFEQTGDKLNKDKALAEAGAEYINAPYNKPVYTRIEKILTRAFEGMPSYAKPNLTGNKADHVYELRSYEGHTEKIYLNKVEMFNKGDEIGLFARLGFNAVFYSEVISGATMPNLMYMTSFNNMKERDEHWKAFSADEQWKKLSADPRYQRNVSKNVTLFLRPTEYSEL
jgi:hypothetical protein